MKYLCAVYFEPKVMEGLSASEGAELNRISLQYNEELRKKAHFIAASALQLPKAAKTVRSRGGKIAMTDGPFAETKEVLGGFIFIEARTWRRRCGLRREFLWRPTEVSKCGRS